MNQNYYSRECQVERAEYVYAATTCSGSIRVTGDTNILECIELPRTVANVSRYANMYPQTVRQRTRAFHGIPFECIETTILIAPVANETQKNRMNAAEFINLFDNVFCEKHTFNIEYNKSLIFKLCMMYV